MIEPLQEIIGYKGTHPHGGNAWLPPEARELWRSSEETPFFYTDGMERMRGRKANNDEVTLCPGAPTLFSTSLWSLWNPSVWILPFHTCLRWQRTWAVSENVLKAVLDADVPMKAPQRIKGWKVSQEESHKAEIRELIAVFERETQPKLWGNGMPILGYCGFN